MPAINPFVDNLDHLKDNEVENKLQDLSRKYWLTHNPDVRNQIGVLIQIYREEQQTRAAKALQDSYQNRNKDLDNLIQVN